MMANDWSIIFRSVIAITAAAIGALPSSAGEIRSSRQIKVYEQIRPTVVTVHVASEKSGEKKSRSIHGVIVDSRGYVVTSSEIESEGESLGIELCDGRQFAAESVAVDENLGIRLLKVHTEGQLPAAQFGESAKVKLADAVTIISGAYGFNECAVDGIVSTIDFPQIRDVKMFCVSVAIGPGIGPGSVFDAQGKLIGYTPKRGGMCRVVPADELRDFVLEATKPE